MDDLIVLRKIRIESANAIAGLTWGFPAITQFLGFVHALQRKLQQVNTPEMPVKLLGCGIVCHQHQTQAYAKPLGDYVFSLTRNPVEKSGKPAPFVEEGKMSLEVSLVIPVEDCSTVGLTPENIEQIKSTLQALTPSMRIAGGVVINSPHVDFYTYEDIEARETSILRSLQPGFALVGRDDLLENEREKREEKEIEDAHLQAWMRFGGIEFEAHQNEKEPQKARWEVIKREGWICPIAVGYRAVSDIIEPGELKRSRDPNIPAQFVESIYSLGEWLAPLRVDEINQLFWYYDDNELDNLGEYRCTNDYVDSL